MRISMLAAVAAGILLSAAPAFAAPSTGADLAKAPDTARGLVPEQVAPPPVGVPVHVVRGAHNASGGSLPEPASWGLMIIGFGGMGAVLRSRRRLHATSA
jgi:hypothetical protein|nr:hypothetical protein [Phenylobacterium sp.]